MSTDGRGNPHMNLKNYAGALDYNRSTEAAGFIPTNKWKHTGIRKEDKEDKPSMIKRMSNFARSLADDLLHPGITLKAIQNYKRTHPHGGKKRSRKYRKNRKTRSRKNRKTRSRK